jgi:hypothetical protein
LISKIRRHVPLFIEETAMGLTTIGFISDNKAAVLDFKV